MRLERRSRRKLIVTPEDDRPTLGWLALAQARGSRVSATTLAERPTDALARGLATPGPHLVEAVLRRAGTGTRQRLTSM
jgi:acetolactate synthase I/II/III large subunit